MIARRFSIGNVDASRQRDTRLAAPYRELSRPQANLNLRDSVP
jgi:hypothetical protein